jgi:hypothetical protein
LSNQIIKIGFGPLNAFMVLKLNKKRQRLILILLKRKITKNMNFRKQYVKAEIKRTVLCLEKLIEYNLSIMFT